ALTCGQDKALILWDVKTGNIIRRFEGHTDVVESADFSPDGQTLLTGSDDKTVILWDVATGKLIHQFDMPEAVYVVTFSPDTHQAFIGVGGGTGYLLNLASGAVIQRFIGHTRSLWSGVFSPDGKHLLTAGTDRWIGLWDIETGQLINRLQGHSGNV